MSTLWMVLAVIGVTALMFGIGALIGEAIAKWGRSL